MNSSFDILMDTCKSGIREFLTPLKSAFDIFSNVWISFGIIAVIFALLLTYCAAVRRDGFKRYLKKADVLAVCSLMIALNVILGYFTINFSAYLRVGFGFITQPVTASLFGPIVACLTGMIQDFISLILRPTGPFNPAYSISVGITSVFYGLVLYKKPVTLLRVLAAEVLVTVVGNILLNTIALSPAAGSGFIGIFPARVLKNLLILPIKTVIVYAVLNFVNSLEYTKNIQGSAYNTRKQTNDN